MKTVPFHVLSVAHPTIIGLMIPFQRIVDPPEAEMRIEQIGQKAEESGARLRRALLEEISKNQTQS